MSTFRKITEEQANAIMNNYDAFYLPFLALNEAGEETICEWIERNAKEYQDIDQWFHEAEDAANNAVKDESIIIEMLNFYTKSGNTHTLIIDRNCFDWMIIYEN